MKSFIATIKIISFAGEITRDYTIKAKTEKSAEKKAYQIIGNQTGELITIKPA